MKEPQVFKLQLENIALEELKHLSESVIAIMVLFRENSLSMAFNLNLTV